MKTTWFPDDDILVVRLSDAPAVREISQGWNVNVSFDAAGNIVEIVVLDAKRRGALPVEAEKAA